MKIAMVSHRILPHRGGIETHVDQLSRALAILGHDVTVFAQGDERSSRWTSDGVEVRTTKIRLGDESYPFAPGLWTELRRSINQYDVVHAHNYQGLAALIAGFSGRNPFVFTPHYHGQGHTAVAKKLHMIYRPLGRALFDRATRVICVSNAERRAVMQSHPRVSAKITVIPNGIVPQDSVAPHPWSAKTELVVAIGRLEPYKRLDLVISAVAKLPESVHLEIIGSGRDESRLTRMISELGIQKRVRMLGALSDAAAARVLAEAKVLVTASEQEAFGLVILEGRQAGARVVASALPAHQEVARLDAGGGVQLWMPESGVKGLSSGILRAIEGRDPGAMTDAPRWQEVAAATADVYRSALERRPVSQPAAGVPAGRRGS